MDRMCTVSELSRIIKGILEPSLPSVRVTGEISNFRPASSGHWYFTLKDDNAVIQAVMFRGRNSTLGFLPYDGQSVEVRASVQVYEQRGVYQLVCEAMEDAGRGRMHIAIELRKQKLLAEGLFEPSRKKSLPKFPGVIAVITSPTGAALQDILRVLRRRHSGITVRILPCSVQGENASREVIEQLVTANRHSVGDVIIVARGGGSFEDLLPFSDESLVRQIAASKIPVISAIGHEIDTPLCDFAADLRAPTPSAAAEMVCASQDALAARVREAEVLQHEALDHLLALRKNSMRPLGPAGLHASIRRILEISSQRRDEAVERMNNFVSQRTRELGRVLENAARTMDVLNPRAPLDRGWTLVRNSAGNVVRSAAMLRETATDSELKLEFVDEILTINYREKHDGRSV